MKSSAAGRGRRSSLVILLVLTVVVVLAYGQSQRIIDWVRMYGYQPPAAISSIADQTAMTASARHLFYLNQPALEEKDAFRGHCPDYEATIVIGCYRQGQRGIYLLKVEDPRLEGVVQVTAAHEMLHAAYDRLSHRQRTEIDNWLQRYAKEQLADERIKTTLRNYEKTEPGEQNNEMHSIFGTEIEVLPPELEQHYAKYFSNRRAVAKLAAQYQDAFTSRQNQVKEYDSRLNALNERVKDGTQKLADQRNGLTALEDEMQGYRSEGQTERYNASVSDYNQRVAAYNSLLEQTKALIADYNQLVNERNAVAAQTVELRQAIDSSALPKSP